MMRDLTIVALVFVLAGGVLLAQEAEEEKAKYVFFVEDSKARVWANLTLTGQRADEPYIPIVVGVQNIQQKSVTLDQASFRISDLDDLIYVMPTVKAWRKSYDKIVMDRRTMSASGIPWQVWQTGRRLGETNFFPDLRSERGNVLRDSVTLRKGYGMVDILYFERPRNFSANRPFFLEVWGEGWESPIKMRLMVF